MGIKAVWKALTETTNDTIVTAGKVIQATGSATTDVVDSMEDYASLLKKESAKAFLGLEDEDEFDFKERFTSLKAEFEAQLAEEAKLNQAIAENLAKVTV